MLHPAFKAYEGAISNIGFEPVGTVINLDSVETGDGGKLGLGMECLDRDLWEFEPVLDEIKALGIGIARIQSGWQKTERVEGVYDFRWLDNVVDRLSEKGIEVLMCLCYGNKLYCDNPEAYPNIEHGGVGHFPINTERERKAWTDYVRSTVLHFKDRVCYFEIWNEPDVKTFLHTQEIWCETYMDFVKLTSPVIRKAFPQAQILSCTALLANGERLVDRGVAEYCDIHSYHNYSAWPETRVGEQTSVLSYIAEKAPNLRIWRGEAGFPSYNDPRSKGALSGRYVSEVMQAKFILRHITNDMANDYLEKTFYFHAYDFEHFMKIVRYHYGVLRHEEPRRKPSYYALQLLSHLFDGKIVSDKSVSLAFAVSDKWNGGRALEKELSETEALSLRFHTFKNGDSLFFAYYLPLEITDETFAKGVYLTVPKVEGLKNPVILDPLTRKIYPISDRRRFFAPVTDYPMFVVDSADISGICELSEMPLTDSAEDKIEQFYEE